MNILIMTGNIKWAENRPFFRCLKKGYTPHKMIRLKL